MFNSICESVGSKVADSNSGRFGSAGFVLLAVMLVLPLSALAELPTEMQLPIKEAVEEAVENSTRILGGEFGGPIAVIYLGDDSNRFPADFLQFVKAELVRADSVEIDSPEKFAERLETSFMDFADLGDQAKRQAFYQSPQGSPLQWVVLLDSENHSTEIVVSVTVEKVESGQPFLPTERTIPKLDNIFEYLGEPLVIYYEDFSTVEEGLIPETWIGGDHLLVRIGEGPRGRKELVPFEAGAHSFTIPGVEFPENWEVELQVEISRWNRQHMKWTFGDIVVLLHGVELVLNQTRVKPGIAAGQMHHIRITKNGRVLTLYADGSKRTVARVGEIAPPQGIHFSYNPGGSIKIRSIKVSPYRGN